MVDIKKVHEGNYEVLIVVGEVDASSSIELDNAMKNAIEETEKNLLVDCTSLEYISSAGLGVFMSYLEDLKKKEINLVFYGMNEKVLNVFKILGLDQLLIIRKDKEEAKAALDEV